MNILFDQGVPAPLRRFLHPHAVDTCAERGWSDASYDVFITTDQNLRHQQTLSLLSIGILVLRTTSWPRIRTGVDRVAAALDRIAVVGYIEINFA